MTFDELDSGIREHMLLADTGILKLLLAILVANRLEIIPPWVMIVGGSATGKSMILNGVKDIPGIIKLDDLTTNTFLSGQKNPERSSSLLDNLPAHCMLCFSDFTTMISKNIEVRGEIFGQMRRLWDGDMHKKTGNGVNKDWEGKRSPGVLGACTTTIYEVLPEMGDMGERLVLYHMTPPDRKAVAKFAIRRLNDKKNELLMRDMFTKYIAELTIPEVLPEFSIELEDELIDLADLATRARSSVKRDKYDRNKSQLFVHDLEGPSRLLKTIMSVAMGMAVINGTNDLTAEDKHTLYRLALDSIPLLRKKVLNSLTVANRQKSDDVQIRINMDKGVVDRTLQDLNSLEVVVKAKGMSGAGMVWSLQPEFRRLLAKFEGIVMEAENVPVDIGEKVVEQPEEEPVLWDTLLNNDTIGGEN